MPSWSPLILHGTCSRSPPLVRRSAASRPAEAFLANHLWTWCSCRWSGITSRTRRVADEIVRVLEHHGSCASARPQSNIGDLSLSPILPHGLTDQTGTRFRHAEPDRPAPGLCLRIKERIAIRQRLDSNLVQLCRPHRPTGLSDLASIT